MRGFHSRIGVTSFFNTRLFMIDRLFISTLGIIFTTGTFAAPTYEHDITPLLRTYCAGCHNDRDAEGGLSVETFASLRRGGEFSGDPLSPGNIDASVMIERIRSTDSDHMPPLDEPQLPAEAIAVIEAWVAAGAPGPAEDRSILTTLAVPTLPHYTGRKPVVALAVSPAGDRLAVVRERSLEIMPRKADGTLAETEVVAVDDLPGRLTAAHFDATGKRLVVAGGLPGLFGVAEIRDVATGKVLSRFEGHRDLLYDAELSPDGALLATAGYDMAVKVWNVTDGSLHWENTVHNGAVFDLAWHPSGTILATASADETVKLWRTRDGLRLDTLSQPQGEVFCVLFSSEGDRVIAAGRDKRIHVWELVSRTEPAINPVVFSRFAHESPVTAISLSADGRHLLSSAEDRTLTGWSLPELIIEQTHPLQSDVVAAIEPVGNQLLIGRMDGSLSAVSVARNPVPGADSGSPVVVPHRPASTAPAGEATARNESEPNDQPAGAEPVGWPTTIRGTIGRQQDADCFRFTGQAGVPVLLEVNAARSKSQLDSKIEVLDEAGNPIPRVLLQATRDSWLTFRGKNSTQAGDFRVHNWREMELDEYLYVGGEAVRLWFYPRGPDSGFDVYPGFGNRHTFFGTTAVAHALGEPAWIVRPQAPESDPVPNGLPMFPVYWENDDECQRRLSTDSQLIFTPPAPGEYVVRVTDTRGFGAAGRPEDFHYTLTIRKPRPSFSVAVGGKNPKVSPGSGREIVFTASRIEGYDGPIRIEVDNLPPGFTFHGPLEIEAGQFRAFGVLSAAADAADPDEVADKAVRVTATAPDTTARSGPTAVEPVKLLGDLGNIVLTDPPKVTIEIAVAARPDPSQQVAATTTEGRGEPPVLTIRPGQTIKAKVKATRHNFEGRIEVGKGTDAGRNLPFGVFVDNIGLNGLLIVEGQQERDFFLTASPVARPGRQLFHLKADTDGGQCSPPVVIEVVPDAG
jgi:WD40 repeat protein